MLNRSKEEWSTAVYGEWIEDYEIFTDDGGNDSSPTQTGWVCSECGSDGIVSWRFCKNCGVKMAVS